MTLSGLRREAIERWQAERLAAVAGGTVNKEMMRLKHLLTRARVCGYLRESPARDIPRAKEAPGRVRYLTADELTLLLEGRRETVTASDGRTWTIQHAPNPVLQLYIVAALQSGARRSELLTLRWRDVDMKALTLTFRHTRNRDARSIPMTSTLRAAAGPPAPLGRRRAGLPSARPEGALAGVQSARAAPRHPGSDVPRFTARRGQHVDDGGRLPTRGHGDARASGSARQPPLPAPRARAPARRGAGARHPAAPARGRFHWHYYGTGEQGVTEVSPNLS